MEQKRRECQPSPWQCFGIWPFRSFVDARFGVCAVAEAGVRRPDGGNPRLRKADGGLRILWSTNMTRWTIAGWCVVGLMVMATSLAAQQSAYQSKPETITATIESIDKATRVVTLKGP